MFSYDKLQEIKFDKILAGGNTEKTQCKGVILRERDTSESLWQGAGGAGREEEEGRESEREICSYHKGKWDLGVK